MERHDPPTTADERDTLVGYLNWQRATILRKTEGLDREQMNRAHPPSTLTLASLLKHLWLVEESWIRERYLGLPEAEPWLSLLADDVDADFHTAIDDDPDDLRAAYRRACAENDAVIAAHDLDERAAVPLRNGDEWTLRWVLLHLIEETARHAGHADLIREAIDGEVGE